MNVYRAAHQSITADEALTYEDWIVNPFNWLFTVYDANNHVLHTLLCRLSVRTLGVSEFTMRIPSLLGGLLYLVFVYRLCVQFFKRWWTFSLAMASLTLNPYIMDYLSAARGYGMGLGLFTAALYFETRFLEDPWRPSKYDGAGVAAALLGLAIAANLIFLYPAIAMSGAISLLLLADTKHTESNKDRLLRIISRVWLPMAALAVFFLAIPLSHAHKDAFYYGARSLRESTLSVVARSLFHQYDIWTVGIGPPIVTRITYFVADWLVPLMLATLAITLAVVFSNWLRHRDVQILSQLDRAYYLIGAVITVCLAMNIAAHALAGVSYPRDRTAIYLVMLLTLAWIMLIEKAVNEPVFRRVMGLIAGVPMAIAIVFFLRGFTTSYYYEWRYDAGTKRAFEYLQRQAFDGSERFTASNPMKVGVNWKSNYTFNFYQDMYHADWMAHVERDPGPAAGGFDYYVLLHEDLEPTNKLGLRVIYRDAISTQEVAAPRTSSALAFQVGHSAFQVGHSAFQVGHSE